jgi:hypothetical protein
MRNDLRIEWKKEYGYPPFLRLFIPAREKEATTMKGLRGIRGRTLKEGTLIATVDIGLTTNTGYCTILDGRDTKPFRLDNTRPKFPHKKGISLKLCC